MKKLLVTIAFLGLICLPAMAKNSCDADCNHKCVGMGHGFQSCFDNCKNSCVPKKTGDKAQDARNTFSNKCAGKGHAFQSCFNSCVKNYH